MLCRKHRCTVERLKIQMKRILMLLALAETFNGIHLWSIQPDSKSNYTIVKNFNLIKDAVAIKSVSNIENLHFINANIDSITQSFSNRLERCIRLTFTNGTVKSVLINPRLWMIDLNNTSTEQVIIEQGQEYKLETLLIRKSKLTKIPQNLNQLTRMIRIDIIDSWIESVSLNDFNGLDHLYEIDLSGNRIKHVYIEDLITLPTLFRLRFHTNQLEQLDTCRWKMPSLAELRLNNNKLMHCAVGHFHSLQILTLASNPLNCAWMNSLQRLLEQNVNNIRLDSDFIQDEWLCSPASLGVFDVHCSPRPIQVQQVDTDLNKTLEKIESTLQKLDSKINDQYNLANDIIEAMYRMAMEREYKVEKNV